MFGNMIADQNKTITSIVYNHLNLPLQINFANGGTIMYVYDATGVKQSKIVTANNTASTTKYLNGFQYTSKANGLASDVELQFFPTAEGYVNHTFTNNQSYFNYVYNYTDHLGNIRLSYTLNEVTQEIQTLEEHHYYPFGLELINIENTAKKAFSKETTDITTTTTGTLKAPIITQVPNSRYQYQYNGKEFQDELGLNVTAFGWRDYDHTIGRFNKMDRLAEKYHKLTPYGYAGNNPVLINDIQGDSLWISFGRNNVNRAMYKDGQLYNKDGSRYEGSGVKVKKDGSIKITDSFLNAVVNGLNEMSASDAKNGTDVISTLQSSENNFTVISGTCRFDPGTTSQPYLFENRATYNQTTQTGLVLHPFWDAKTMGYSLLPADKAGTSGIIYFDGSNASSLAHESMHAYDANSGNLIHTPIEDPRTHINGTVIGEIRAVHYENQIKGGNFRESYSSGGYQMLNANGTPKAQIPPTIINK